MAATSPKAPATGNFLTHKLFGRVPMWVAILGGVAAAYAYQSKKAGSSSSTTSNPNAVSGAEATLSAAGIPYSSAAGTSASSGYGAGLGYGEGGWGEGIGGYTDQNGPIPTTTTLPAIPTTPPATTTKSTAPAKTTTSPAPGKTTKATGPSSSLYAATIDVGGQEYNRIATPAAGSAAEAEGQTVYLYNPDIPGVVAPANAKTLAAAAKNPGTSQYIKG